MILQISSGIGGAAECELAVGKLYDALKAEHPGIELIKSRQGRRKGCFTSILLSADYDIPSIVGSIQWICRSPFRPNHGRKNWYVDVSMIPETEEVDENLDVKVETFHSGGHGGQNVNKVETGVRVVHLPTGIAVSSTARRSQYQNKQEALRKLFAILRKLNEDAESGQRHEAWREQKVERGNPVRIYQGLEFTRVK